MTDPGLAAVPPKSRLERPPLAICAVAKMTTLSGSTSASYHLVTVSCLMGACVNGKSIPSFEEFRDCVLAAYAPLIRTMGFVELPRRQGMAVNRFTVRIGNATTIIEVEGIHWGTAAWTKVFRTSGGGAGRREGLPINRLLQLRRGLQVERAQKRRRKQPDQLADINETAAAILEHARDVLKGDFSELERVAEQERRFHQEQLKRALPKEQKAAVVAASEAGHAFRRGDYAKVVELLGPHLPHLSPSQQQRYALAKSAAGVQQK